MAKRFRCREMGWKCGYVMTATTTVDLLPRVEEHLRTSHNLAVVPQDFRAKMEGAVHEVPDRKRVPSAPGTYPSSSVAAPVPHAPAGESLAPGPDR